MPEWSIGPHSKCGVRATVPGVRIPLSPQNRNEARRCRQCRHLFVFWYMAQIYLQPLCRKTKDVDLSTPCGVYILQGAHRRGKGSLPLQREVWRDFKYRDGRRTSLSFRKEFARASIKWSKTRDWLLRRPKACSVTPFPYARRGALANYHEKPSTYRCTFYAKKRHSE